MNSKWAKGKMQYSEEANRLADADPVRAYLRSKNYRDEQAVLQGLEYFVERWERAIAFLDREIHRGFWQQDSSKCHTPFGAEEYMNSLHQRDTLEYLLTLASADQREEVRERIAKADEDLRELTFESATYLYGRDNEARDRLKREIHWWWYRVPNTSFDWSERF